MSKETFNNRTYELVKDPYWKFDELYNENQEHFLVKRIDPPCPLTVRVFIPKQLIKADIYDWKEFIINDWLATAIVSQKNDPEKWDDYEL